MTTLAYALNIRSSFKLIVAVLSLLVIDQTASAKQPQVKKCPKVIAHPGMGIYQTLQPNQYWCFSSAKELENFKKTMKKSDAGFQVLPSGLCSGGGSFAVASETDLSGEGTGQGVPFQVYSRSKLVEYYWSGPGSFQIDLVDYASKHSQSLVSGSGEMGGSTYINYPGRYYLKISGKQVKVDGFLEGDWDVSVQEE